MNQKLIAIGKPRKNTLGFQMVKTVLLDVSNPLSLEKIKSMVKLNCFVVLIPEDGIELPDPLELIETDMDLPAGQIFSVGHEEPEFMSVVDFLTRIDQMEENDKELLLVGENMRDCAYEAEDINFNNVFTSRCTYVFFGEEHIPVKNVVEIGFDDLGFYLKREEGTFKYALRPLAEEEV
jgi:predicted Zn-ribbon and HTH transcriptional regulator